LKNHSVDGDLHCVASVYKEVLVNTRVCDRESKAYDGPYDMMNDQHLPS